MEFHHVSVLLNECIENLNIKPDGVYVDCTMGGAGPVSYTHLKNDKLRVVNIKDIYYCEARERETIVYTKDSEYIVKESIKEFEKNLDTNLFFKTHRSYIVNVSKINEIIPWFNNTYKLKLDDINSEIPVSRSKIKDFRIIMNI